MNYNTVYVGMDVHKESFTLCAFTIEKDKGKYHQKTDPDVKNVLKYLEFLRSIYGDNAKFVCGYEAGCLVYTLYHQLTSHDVDCKILAPTTMLGSAAVSVSKQIRKFLRLLHTQIKRMNVLDAATIRWFSIMARKLMWLRPQYRENWHVSCGAGGQIISPNTGMTSCCQCQDQAAKAVLRRLDIIIPLLWWVNKQM